MDISPFRGYRFDIGKIGDLNKVVTQPHDKISDALRETYGRRSPYNMSRIILPKPRDGDSDSDNRYTRAADSLRSWIDDGVIVQDEKPAIYAYYQIYRMHAVERIRKGFIALGGLAEFSTGTVRPHEKTQSGPLADRLNLLRATRANFGPVFMLYSDPESKVNAILDRHAASPPDLEAVDDAGEMHRIWRVQDAETIERIRAFLKDREVFIADGHHRYEAALIYRNESREGGLRSSTAESPENRMMTFVNMDDPGLTILAGHRAFYNVDPAKITTLLDVLARDFEIEDFGYSQEDEGEVRRTFLRSLAAAEPGVHRFGLALAGRQAYFTISLRDERLVEKAIKGEHSDPWKRLDVSILHALILEPHLGIGDSQLEREENVDFIRVADQAVDGVHEGRYQGVFMLNPTKISEVREVAVTGERMPQKSTDFYPKLLTGLVINRIELE